VYPTCTGGFDLWNVSAATGAVGVLPYRVGGPSPLNRQEDNQIVGVLLNGTSPLEGGGRPVVWWTKKEASILGNGFLASGVSDQPPGGIRTAAVDPTGHYVAIIDGAGTVEVYNTFGPTIRSLKDLSRRATSVS